MSYNSSKDPLTQIYQAMGLFSEVSKAVESTRQNRGQSALYKINLILADQRGNIKYPNEYNNDVLQTDIESMETLVNDGHINLDKLDTNTRDFYNFHLKKMKNQQLLNVEYETTIDSLETLENNLIKDIDDFRDIQTTTMDRYEIIGKVKESAKTYASMGDKLQTKFGTRLKNDSYAINQLTSYEYATKGILRQLRFDDLIIDDNEYKAAVNTIEYNDPKIMEQEEKTQNAILSGTAQGYVERMQKNAENYHTLLQEYKAMYGKTWGQFASSSYSTLHDTEVDWKLGATQMRNQLTTMQGVIEKYQGEYEQISKGSRYNVVLDPIPLTSGGNYPGSGISSHATSKVSVKGVKVSTPSPGLIGVSQNIFDKHISNNALTKDLGARNLAELKEAIEKMPVGDKRKSAKQLFNRAYMDLNNKLKSLDPAIAKENPNITKIKDLYPDLEKF